MVSPLDYFDEWRKESRDTREDIKALTAAVSDLKIDVAVLNERTELLLQERTDAQPGKGRPMIWGSVAGGVVVGAIEAIRSIVK